MENDYKKNLPAYKKSSHFLFSYSWKGKTKEQIIIEMGLLDYEQVYLDDAMKELARRNQFSGYDLDRYILQRLDMEEEDDFDPNDVIYLERR
ncbi:MAG: hypothetical protein IMW92_02725 [Bacillales bacterium]|nr:hypothetical protein [Bacillales bacterium]